MMVPTIFAANPERFPSFKYDEGERKPYLFQKNPIPENPIPEKVVPLEKETVVPKMVTIDAVVGSKQEIFVSRMLPQIQKAKDEIGEVAQAIPDSLIVAQAALESGWGESFSAKKRNNLFGLTERNGGLMYFQDTFDSIVKYLLTLSNHQAHQTFRDKLGLVPPMELPRSLVNYAENPAYASQVRSIMKRYGLTALDQRE